jgi:hypothetical protein
MNLLPVAFHFEDCRFCFFQVHKFIHFQSRNHQTSAMSRDQQLLFVEGLHGMVTRKLRYFDWQEWQLRRRAQ